uniref:Uncharacterized protein n=1 Tax=Anguilla anguilla TaxID=7936 RepID=A0A0E9T350_ANGAN
MECHCISLSICVLSLSVLPVCVLHIIKEAEVLHPVDPHHSMQRLSVWPEEQLATCLPHCGGNRLHVSHSVPENFTRGQLTVESESTAALSSVRDNRLCGNSPIRKLNVVTEQITYYAPILLIVLILF